MGFFGFVPFISSTQSRYFGDSSSNPKFSVAGKCVLKPATAERLFTYFTGYLLSFFNALVVQSLPFLHDIEDSCSTSYAQKPTDVLFLAGSYSRVWICAIDCFCLSELFFTSLWGN